MVASTGIPVVGVVQPSTQLSLEATAAADASISRYLASGERVRVLMDVALKICIALLVLVAAAWIFGVLPGAVRPL